MSYKVSSEPAARVYIKDRGEEVYSMFESLDESIKHELQGEASDKERIIRYVVISAVSVIVIVALYYAVKFLG